MSDHQMADAMTEAVAALCEIESMAGAAGSGETPALPLARRARAALACISEALLRSDVMPTAPDPRLRAYYDDGTADLLRGRRCKP